MLSEQNIDEKELKITGDDGTRPNARLPLMLHLYDCMVTGCEHHLAHLHDLITLEWKLADQQCVHYTRRKTSYFSCTSLPSVSRY